MSTEADFDRAAYEAIVSEAQRDFGASRNSFDIDAYADLAKYARAWIAAETQTLEGLGGKAAEPCDHDWVYELPKGRVGGAFTPFCIECEATEKPVVPTLLDALLAVRAAEREAIEALAVYRAGLDLTGAYKPDAIEQLQALIAALWVTVGVAGQ